MIFRRTGLLLVLILVSVDVFAQVSLLDRAYDHLDKRQYAAAAAAATAYLNANPRRYRADFILAFAQCNLQTERQRGMERVAAIERDYVLTGEAERDVASLIAFCAPKPKTEPTTENAGNKDSFTSDSLEGLPRFKSAASDKTDWMSALVPGTSYSGDDYKTLIGFERADQCSEMCRAEERCRSMTYAKSSKTCWLKRSVPPAQQGADFVSAFKRK